MLTSKTLGLYIDAAYLTHIFLPADRFFRIFSEGLYSGVSLPIIRLVWENGDLVARVICSHSHLLSSPQGKLHEFDIGLFDPPGKSFPHRHRPGNLDLFRVDERPSLESPSIGEGVLLVVLTPEAGKVVGMWYVEQTLDFITPSIVC